MRFRVLPGLALLTVASAVQAQNAPAHPSCTGVTANACQQAVDMFTYVSPLLGTAIVGGNTTMGQGGSLGTRLGLIPHVSVGVRINAVFGGVPVSTLSLRMRRRLGLCGQHGSGWRPRRCRNWLAEYSSRSGF